MNLDHEYFISCIQRMEFESSTFKLAHIFYGKPGEPLTMADFEESTGVNVKTITSGLARLRKMGFIIQKPNKRNYVFAGFKSESRLPTKMGNPHRIIAQSESAICMPEYSDTWKLALGIGL